MKIKINPLFFVLVLITVAFGQARYLIWTFLAVTAHECGHSLAARSRGYLTKSIEIMPFGAVMSLDNNLDGKSGVLVGLAGPLVNLLLSVVLPGIWWLYPSAYSYTEPFLQVNLSLAIFNLLPVYPLDGGRVVVSIAKNKLRAVKGVRIAGVVVGSCFLALFVLSVFYGINFLLAVVGIFLIYGGICPGAEEEYVCIFAPGAKDYSSGVEEKVVAVDGSVPIARLFRFTGPKSKTVFKVLSEKGEIVVDEERLSRLARGNKLSLSIGEALKNESSKADTNALKEILVKRRI